MPPVSGLKVAVLPADAVEVGRVQEAWGVKGWVKVHSHSADPQVLLNTNQWFLTPPQGRHARGFDAFQGVVSVEVSDIKTHSDGIVAKLSECPDRNAAEALKNAVISVPRSQFPSSGDSNEYYWVNLIGLRVVNREGVDLGVVTDLLPTGPHSVLCLEHDVDGKAHERLIPFVSVYVDNVDVPSGRITVDWHPDY